MTEETARKRERLFGRRKGRPLRGGRVRLMDDLLPRFRLFLSEGAKIELESLFDFPFRRLEMEIGFGGGEHLAAQAFAHPETGFIGCEPFVNGVASLLTHIEAKNLRNVILYPDDARHVLEALPDACLDRCFVLFADPWPKKRHAERRFIGKENLDRLARVIKSGGELRLATDVVALAEWMRGKAGEHGSFSCLYDGKTPPVDWVSTRYEQKGRAAGRDAEYLVYKRS